MHGSHDFELVEFVEYLYDRRFLFLISCGVAVGLTLAIGAFLPRQYTAKSSVLIEPPGNDARAATVLSPAYVESLRSWESFAGSDTLYARAAAPLQIKEPKSSVVKITRPPSSTVLEINVTLRDPVKAQALAQNLAEQTVELSRTVEAKSGDDLAGELRKQLEAAQERLSRASQALAAFAASSPVASPENDIRSGFDFRLRLDQELSTARTNLAELQAQGKAASVGASDAVRQITSIETRIRAMESQQRDLTASLALKGAALDAIRSRRAALEDEQRAARAAYEELRAKLNESLASSQLGKARLHIIDPGVTPRETSSPNMQINLIAAFLASLIATLACLVVRFGYVRLQRERSERLYSLR